MRRKGKRSLKPFTMLEKIIIGSVLGFAALFIIGFFLFWFVISNAVAP